MKVSDLSEEALERRHAELLAERDGLHRSLKAVNGNLDEVRAERVRRAFGLPESTAE